MDNKGKRYKMRKAVCIFVILFLCAASFVFAQEMQLSLGADFNFGVFKTHSTTFIPTGNMLFPNSYYVFDEDLTSSFFSTGLSIFVRAFPESNAFLTRGFIFRDRAIFVTSWEESGYINGVYVSEEFTIKDSMISIMDFGLGLSYRFKFPKGFYFYTDLGINLTIMDVEDNFTDYKMNYLGAGFLMDIAMQYDITQKVYLEFGLNTIMNVFSSQEGQFRNPYNLRQILKFDNTGRWDLTMAALYLHVGWKIDLKELAALMYAPY